MSFKLYHAFALCERIIADTTGSMAIAFLIPLVDCAIAANAKCIVTEDKHFKVLENIPFPKVEVIGIEDFKCYLDRWI